MSDFRALVKIVLFVGVVPFISVLSLASITIWLPGRLLRRGGGGVGSAPRRALVVAPFDPGSQSGGSKAVEGLITSLRALGITVGLVVPVSRQAKRTAASLMGRIFSPVPVPEECRALAFGSRAVRDELRHHDVAVFEFAATGMYLLFGRLVGRRCVLRDHEVLVRKLLTDRGGSRGADAVLLILRFAATYCVSAAMYLRADAIISLTVEDAAAIRRWFPFVSRKVATIPAPVELPFGLECLRRSNDSNLLMVANFHHAPNVHGLLWFLEECAPLLQSEFTLHVCGLDAPLDGLPDRHGKVRVVRHGFVESPGDIMAMGSIAVAPIISGGGVRIKNLFLASLGMAIVTTPRGNEGIGFVHGRHALVCNDPVDMARSIDKLAGNPELAARLGIAAREYVRNAFGLPSIGGRLWSVVFGDHLSEPSGS